MAKKAEFVGSQNNERPGKEFLLEYQRSVLLALEQEGFWTGSSCAFRYLPPKVQTPAALPSDTSVSTA